MFDMNKPVFDKRGAETFNFVPCQANIRMSLSNIFCDITFFITVCRIAFIAVLCLSHIG